jgi:hypothetical protein
VRVDAPHAAAFVHLAGGIDGLELDAHDSPSWSSRQRLPVRGLAV